MRLVFRTNVDCAKPFVSRLNERGELAEANPLIGDRVTILQENDRVAEMEVVGRTWRTSTPNSRQFIHTELLVELHLTSTWSKLGYDKFENHLKGRN